MRLTLGSTIAVTLALLVGLAVWPGHPMNPPPRADAQDKPPQPAEAQVPLSDDTPAPGSRREVVDKNQESPDAAAPMDKREAAVREKLSKRLPKVEFDDVPLSEALKSIGDEIGVDILIDHQGLENFGVVASETRVRLVLKHTDISARTALDLLLENEGLAYRIRDGFVYVETKEQAAEAMEIQVYNVRDLLEGAEPQVMRVPAGLGMGGMGGFGGGGGGPGGGYFSVPPGGGRAAGSPLRLAQFDMGGGDGFGGEGAIVGGMGAGQFVITPTQALIEVIQTTTSGPWFDETGIGGRISAFDGLLVVRQTQAMHREVQQLLDMMRAAMKEQPRAKKPAKRPPAVPPKVRKGRGADADADDVPEAFDKFDIRRKRPRETGESPESIPPVRPSGN